jgi:2-iminobutanoate/2-iminopropanoate deaminase
MTYARHIRSPIMHRVVAHGETLYFGGMVAEDRSVGIAGQTEQILTRMETMLRECGSDRTKILSANIFMTDLSLKKEMDEVWVRFFGPENLPARATIGGANLGSPDTLIEVVCTASK